MSNNKYSIFISGRRFRLFTCFIDRIDAEQFLRNSYKDIFGKST